MTLKKTALITGASLALGGCYLLHQNRHAINKSIWQQKIKSIINTEKKRIIIVENEEQWKNVENELLECCKNFGAIGFDCEWVTTKKSRRPVALVQLATQTNLCVLVRLNKLKNIPESFKEILFSPYCMKIGVAPVEDCKNLFSDHNLIVNGILDLKTIIQPALNNLPSKKKTKKKQKNEKNNSIANGVTTSKIKQEQSDVPADTSNLPAKSSLSLSRVPENFGLNSLSKFYLDRPLDKDWRIRASDWETDHLSARQIHYAAEDARCGLHILLQIILESNFYDQFYAQNPSVLLLLRWVSFTRDLLFSAVESFLTDTPNGGWNNRDNGKYSNSFVNLNNRTQSNPQQQNIKGKSYRRAYSLRKTPLYHNSLLWAPDNEPLCTVDPKKALWYVDNNLGEIVKDDPLIVRLLFEPTGRPQKEGNDGYFYLNERQNKCVVCGKEKSYIRKNVVPHEYRKHFPEILKSHQNHDVVLLCTSCHQISNQRDSILRYKLAEEHDAPIGNTTDVKLTLDGSLKIIKSAGNALLKSASTMPAERTEELKQILRDYFKTDDLTTEMYQKASTLDITIVNDNYIPHGLKVYKHYEKIGVIQLEILWRKYFLDSMSPQFMPEGWDINHNHNKLKLKMSRHPLDDPVRVHYKTALVGTEGEIDVPYVEQNARKRQEEIGRHVKENT